MQVKSQLVKHDRNGQIKHEDASRELIVHA